MRNFFTNEFDPNNKIITRKIKEWVKQYFKLQDHACVIMVTEVRCVEENCPDVETVISIIKQPEPMHFKIGKPIMYVRATDIYELSKNNKN
jgi:hypothetical protein